MFHQCRWEYPPQGVIMHLRVVFPTSEGCEFPPQGVIIHSVVVFRTTVGCEYPPPRV